MKKSKRHIANLEKIDKAKLYDIEEAMKIVEGTARNMGIAIQE